VRRLLNANACGRLLLRWSLWLRHALNLCVVLLLALLKAGDVALGISHTGTTRETTEMVAEAASHGATNISSWRRSPLPFALARPCSHRPVERTDLALLTRLASRRSTRTFPESRPEPHAVP